MYAGVICTSAGTRSGCSSVNAIAVAAPIELPTRAALSSSEVVEHRLEVRHQVGVLVARGGGGVAVAARVIRDQAVAALRERPRALHDVPRVADSPWSSTTGGPSPAISPSSVMLPAPGAQHLELLLPSRPPHCSGEAPPPVVTPPHTRPKPVYAPPASDVRPPLPHRPWSRPCPPASGRRPPAPTPRPRPLRPEPTPPGPPPRHPRSGPRREDSAAAGRPGAPPRVRRCRADRRPRGAGRRHGRPARFRSRAPGRRGRPAGRGHGAPAARRRLKRR